MRRRLKRPVGILYAPDKLKTKAFLTALRSAPLVISVGDRVTESLQALGRTPDLQVVDGFERRVKRQAPDVPFVRVFAAANPAGTITPEAVHAIIAALAGETPARVLIDGEEDLLAIPAIWAAPLGSSLYYGQPGKGVVFVAIDERAKSSAEKTLAAMQKG
ncbi:MAG: GTP-dependent dephospho-CoA kinase family protein [Thaumarchaeota archaeon]|nr:GTP-dependent dephospho-CoA kinase family protein [Nitrososphaerota archaeon]